MISKRWRRVRAAVAQVCVACIAAVSGLMHTAAGQQREAAAPMPPAHRLPRT